LIGNKACPTQLIDFEKDENDYNRYRLLKYFIRNHKINNTLINNYHSKYIFLF